MLIEVARRWRRKRAMFWRKVCREFWASCRRVPNISGAVVASFLQIKQRKTDLSTEFETERMIRRVSEVRSAASPEPFVWCVSFRCCSLCFYDALLGGWLSVRPRFGRFFLESGLLYSCVFLRWAGCVGCRGERLCCFSGGEHMVMMMDGAATCVRGSTCSFLVRSLDRPLSPRRSLHPLRSLRRIKDGARAPVRPLEVYSRSARFFCLCCVDSLSSPWRSRKYERGR